MFQKFKHWVNKPYYFNPSIKYKCKISLILGFFLFVFLYVFEPFTLSTFGDYLFTYTLGLGIISILTCILLLVGLPFLLPSFFDEDNWTLGKNFLFIICSLFIIGSALWYYGYFYKLNINMKHVPYYRFLYYTLLVGLFPVTAFVSANQNKISKKREEKAAEINEIKKEIFQETIAPEIVEFYSENNKESLKIHLKDLIYITSEGNYASFFVLDNDVLKEKILRVTLSKIEELLSGSDHIIRCHKSYIINTKYIKGIKGNARGYLLESDYLSFDIPVSRKFSKVSILSLLKHPSYLSQKEL